VVAVVVRAGTTPRAEEVIEHCRSRLASFKKPARVVFVDELPYTPTMKLARAVLREQLASADDQRP
jgi:acyl-coenzyme A synthetase/AMP-(fatty) acid ligase